MQQGVNKSEIIDIIEKLALKTPPRKKERIVNNDSLSLLGEWYQGRYGCSNKVINHPRLALFSSTHGFSQSQNLSDSGFLDYIANCTSGTSALNMLCGQIDCDLRIYELDQIGGTDCFIRMGAAMNDTSFVSACSYGMMAMEESVGVLGLSAMGDGCNESALAIIGLLGDRSDLITQDFSNISSKPAIDLIIEIGGYELCALLGAFIAAKLSDKPILCEGYASLALLEVINSFSPKLLQDVIYVHDSSDSISKSVAADLDVLSVCLPSITGSLQPGTQIGLVLQNLCMINAISKSEILIANADKTLNQCGLNKIKSGLEQEQGQAKHG